MTRCYIQAPAIFGPALEGWSTARPVLRGEAPYTPAALSRPAPGCLPPQERRRSSSTTRLALQVAQESLAQTPAEAPLAALFTSANGDTEIHHHICTALIEAEPMVSPMRFHNSVHNAPAGYWSIANENRCPTNSIAAYDGSFSAGLVTAAAQCLTEGVSALLVAYDLPFVEPLAAQRPISTPFAVALQLTPQPTPHSLAECRMELVAGATRATPMDNRELERLRGDNPMGLALPLMERLACAEAGTLTLDYLDDLALRLEVTPC